MNEDFCFTHTDYFNCTIDSIVVRVLMSEPLPTIINNQYSECRKVNVTQSPLSFSPYPNTEQKFRPAMSIDKPYIRFIEFYVDFCFIAMKINRFFFLLLSVGL